MTAAAESEPASPPAIVRWHALGWIGLVIVYTLVLSLTGFGAASAIGGAISNVVPAAILGLTADRVIRRVLMGRPVAVQLLLHLGLGIAFVGLWYAALIPLTAVPNWLLGYGYHPEPLTGPALPWQLSQGLMIYAVIAAATYALDRPASEPVTAAPTRLTRYLMRQGEDIRPVDVADIITIQGADDYCEVTTARGRHLARMTLSAFERDLDPEVFARVHRSWIVNFEKLDRAESAGGGRLLVHMEDGQTVPTSRAGARSLRDRLV